jgi:hypothetical protein
MTHRPSVLAPAVLAFPLLLAPAMAPAQEVILQNDSFVGGVVGFQDGFAVSEIGAVRLTPPGPFPMALTKVQFLFGGDIGTQTITLHIWDDSAGTTDPGTPLFSNDYIVDPSDSEMQEIDLSGAALSVSGPFRVGIQFQNAGLPSIARDTDGVSAPGRNFICAVLVPGDPCQWFSASDFLVNGDWIIRAGVSTGSTLFADGFESGAMTAWSSAQTAGGDLTVSTAAKMAGTDFGLQLLVNDTASGYVEDDLPNHELRYHARFYFRPNGFDPGEAQAHFRTRIFIAFTNPTRRIAAIVLKRQLGVYSLMGRARLDDNTQANTSFVTITDAPHYVEIDLKVSATPSANDGFFHMWIDGVEAGNLTGLDNSLSPVDFVRMGGLSLKTGAAGTLYWDEFKSTKSSPIGP